MALPPGLLVVPDWMYYSGMASYFLAVVLIGLLIFIGFKTPAFTWIRAMFRRGSIFFLAGRDNVGGFYASKRLGSNWAEIKRQGLFFIAEGSFIFDRKSKKPIYLAHKEIGATINLEWPDIIEKLKEKGFEIKDSKDYKAVVNDKANQDILLELSSGKTIKISDLQKFFPLNIQPTFVKSVTENEKRRVARRVENIKIIAVIGFAVLLVCIGAYILIGRINEAKTTCSCNCEGVNVPGVKASDEKKPDMPELQPGGGVTPGGSIT